MYCLHSRKIIGEKVTLMAGIATLEVSPKRVFASRIFLKSEYKFHQGQTQCLNLYRLK